MATTVSNISKNTTIAVTNDTRPTDLTWAEATFTWDESEPSTWADQRNPVTKDSKNTTITVSNDSKN